MTTIEQRVAELGYTLPAAFPRMGSYESFVRVGNLLYLSGAAPKAPSNVSVEVETIVEVI